MKKFHYSEKYENEQLPGMPSQEELGEAYDAFCAGGGPEKLQSLFQHSCSPSAVVGPDWVFE